MSFELGLYLAAAVEVDMGKAIDILNPCQQCRVDPSYALAELVMSSEKDLVVEEWLMVENPISQLSNGVVVLVDWLPLPLSPRNARKGMAERSRVLSLP